MNAAISKRISQVQQASEIMEFRPFTLTDAKLIKTYVDTFKPLSCEYNFANLFVWQYGYKISWTMYLHRILIYDGLNKCAFMPLGPEFSPEELSILSLKLKNLGFTPDFSLVTPDYIEKYPDIKKYYIVKKERENSEYIYDVKHLCELKGKKLHKKRNLISQFKSAYPDFKIHRLEGEYRHKSLELVQKKLIEEQNKNSITLDHEFSAIKISFDHFDELGLQGLALMVRNRLVAFCVFSELNSTTYDIHFEKSDTNFKGAAQVLNQETAKYLEKKCQYLNREQDLGIKGLRQAKMSYEPLQLITPYSLIFHRHK